MCSLRRCRCCVGDLPTSVPCHFSPSERRPPLSRTLTRRRVGDDRLRGIFTCCHPPSPRGITPEPSPPSHHPPGPLTLTLPVGVRAEHRRCGPGLLGEQRRWRRGSPRPRRRSPPPVSPTGSDRRGAPGPHRRGADGWSISCSPPATPRRQGPTGSAWSSSSGRWTWPGCSRPAARRRRIRTGHVRRRDRCRRRRNVTPSTSTPLRAPRS